MELHAQIACRLPDKVEIIDAGPMAELVYYRACLRCREYLTDGVIAAAHVSRWFAGIPQPRRHLSTLTEFGLLVTHSQGWAIPDDVWRKWIPSRAEVDEKRAAEADRLREYRERKKSERELYARTEDVREQYVRGAYKQPEPEPEPEPEPYIDPQDSYASDDAVIHKLRIGGETAW